MKTIIICAGGTLGHIMPGIAFSKILKQENIKATFFVLGSRVDLYPDIVKRQYAEGHYFYQKAAPESPLRNRLCLR